jgi:hypothetical protein
MASLVLAGDTSGSITVSAPAVAGSTTQTLVATTGTLAPIVSGTAVASTSGTSIDFTSIPSWVKRITVMFSGVSTNGTSQVQIQIGSGSVTTSGYSSATSYGLSAGQNGISTSAFLLEPTAVAAAVSVRQGSIVLSLISANTWVSQGNFYNNATNAVIATSGVSPALSGALDRVRITTVNGTDTFDAGTINILYE